jgi:hypothetical protein
MVMTTINNPGLLTPGSARRRKPMAMTKKKKKKGGKRGGKKGGRRG